MTLFNWDPDVEAVHFDHFLEILGVVLTSIVVVIWISCSKLPHRKSALSFEDREKSDKIV